VWLPRTGPEFGTRADKTGRIVSDIYGLLSVIPVKLHHNNVENYGSPNENKDFFSRLVYKMVDIHRQGKLTLSSLLTFQIFNIK
jgi:hypothetical protein